MFSSRRRTRTHTSSCSTDAVASAGATVRFEEGPSGSQTINLLLAPLMLVRHRLGGYRLLHIHWVFRFSLPWARRSRLGRQAMQWWFMFYLWSAHVLGYRIVWTAHDLLPHEQVFADDRRGREYLIARSDAVIALSQASAAALAELGARDVRVIPFASYADPYPVTLTREEARSQLGIAENDVAVLLIGKIERYKGADLLLEAVAALSPRAQSGCSSWAHARTRPIAMRSLSWQAAQVRAPSSGWNESLTGKWPPT